MPLPAQMKELIRLLMPPVVYRAAAHWLTRQQPNTPALNYVPNGWRDAAHYRGWNAEGVLEAYKATWPRLVRESQTATPLNVIMGTDDVGMQNVLLCFAYSLALAAQNKTALSMLDWGGAIGQYKLLAQAALPGVPIKYHCKDVPLLAEYGQQINPDAYFSSEAASCLSRSYDFILVSSSLHYSEDWQADFRALARAADGYLLLTRTPVNDEDSSFVFSQSAYGSEWLGWSLKRRDLLNCAAAEGLSVVREFMMSDVDIPIVNAPYRSRQRGFLFRSQR